jgi:recombination protein RecT
MGLDPAQPNHISFVPYKNNKTEKYDISFTEGYRGKEIKAVKYGLNPPDHITVELVYETDVFRQIKKDVNNKIDSYKFEITDDFNRGELKGGFYYHWYFDDPTKNEIKVMSKKDIEKRKPKYAAAEFWGGQKTVYKDGKPSGKETIEGWYHEMCYKTIRSAAYRAITIDSQKIDDDFIRVIEKMDEQGLLMKDEKNMLPENNDKPITLTIPENKVKKESIEPDEKEVKKDTKNEDPNQPNF